MQGKNRLVMRGAVAVGLAVVVQGCVAPPEQPASAGAGKSRSPRQLTICPDGMTGCTHSNGAGVYTAEDGRAAIGTAQLMITHFITGAPGSDLTFQGRYFDGQLWRRLPVPGVVYGADYSGAPGASLAVVALSETGTAPTWTLVDRESGQTVMVGAPQGMLTLYAFFIAPSAAGGSAPTYVALELSNPSVASVAPGAPAVMTYSLRWRDLTDVTGATTQYCATASSAPDPVVFQLGMDVEPVTGAVTRDATTANLVTLSCRLGAVATVYGWGYPYVAGSETFYFDAGIQLKRASYCADSQYYTVAGTPIRLADDQGVQRDPIDLLEARWTPTGASCLVPANLRHPEIAIGKGFTGTCNGVAIPPCSVTGGAGPHILADGVVR